MYCTKCGKQIDYDATVCHECAASAKEPEKAAAGGYGFADEMGYTYAPASAPQYAAAPVESTRMVGFGKALTATILGFVGYIFAIVAFVLFALPVGAIVLALMSIALGVVSLVFGVQSIGTFKRLKNGPGGSPIATLILGIAGTVFAGLTLLFAMLAFLMVGVWLMEI